jgi:hypothetical protein
MAAIDRERKAPGREREVAELLWQYLSGFRGPGEINPHLYAALLSKLPSESRERRTLDLFHMFDQIVSNPGSVPRSLAESGVALSQALGHEGAAAYFSTLLAQCDIFEDRLIEARDRFVVLLEPLQRLVAEDPEYAERLNTAETNARVLAEQTRLPKTKARRKRRAPPKSSGGRATPRDANR